MAKKKISDETIEFGNIELDDSDLDFSKGKIRITTMVDMAIYDALKAEAKKRGLKYQTLLNFILREHFAKDDGKTPEERLLEKIFSDVKHVKVKIDKMDKSKVG
jgi:predicted DNA binding CopG/RHH family protein